MTNHEHVPGVKSGVVTASAALSEFLCRLGTARSPGLADVAVVVGIDVQSPYTRGPEVRAQLGVGASLVDVVAWAAALGGLVQVDRHRRPGCVTVSAVVSTVVGVPVRVWTMVDWPVVELVMILAGYSVAPGMAVTVSVEDLRAAMAQCADQGIAEEQALGGDR